MMNRASRPSSAGSRVSEVERRLVAPRPRPRQPRRHRYAHLSDGWRPPIGVVRSRRRSAGNHLLATAPRSDERHPIGHPPHPPHPPTESRSAVNRRGARTTVEIDLEASQSAHWDARFRSAADSHRRLRPRLLPRLLRQQFHRRLPPPGGDRHPPPGCSMGDQPASTAADARPHLPRVGQREPRSRHRRPVGGRPGASLGCGLPRQTRQRLNRRRRLENRSATAVSPGDPSSQREFGWNPAATGSLRSQACRRVGSSSRGGCRR